MWPTAAKAKGAINMKMIDRRIPRVAVTVCALMNGAMLTTSRSLAGFDSEPAEPTAARRQAAAEPERRVPERFMVRYNGCVLLGPDGEEKERLETITSGAGAISPDGLWAAFSQSEPNPPPGERQGKLVIQSRVNPDGRRLVPLIWGTTGSSFQPLWSSDSKRILICEQGHNDDGTRGSAFRVYDLGSNSLTKLHLPNAWWPSDWSADGKRVLTSLRAENGSSRVAWVHVDGSGAPEFLTSDQEVAYGARLSPDNRQILCMVGPRNPGNQGSRTRLYVIELATKKRTVIDKPSHTYGYCWSSDGAKVAYTWQLPLRQPEDVVERKTYLITCDADGTNQKTVTMRKYEVPQFKFRIFGSV
jgi:Tol biopolymer transport system component